MLPSHLRERYGLPRISPMLAEYNVRKTEPEQSQRGTVSPLVSRFHSFQDPLTVKRMPSHSFGSFVFTPTVKALQERYGSRRQYAKLEQAAGSPDRFGEDERAFIAERDSFYMASVGATGWPYIQHRGGPKGFLKVIDERTIAFADSPATSNSSAPAMSPRTSGLR